MVTGKNKKQFEEWYLNDFARRKENIGLNILGIKQFYKSTLEMQLGIYLSYYDFKGVDIGVIKINNKYFSLCCFYVNGKLVSQDLGYKETRNEAYKEALKPADKLMNSN